MNKDDIKLPPEFISTNSIPVTVATIKRERIEEILREAVETDRKRRSDPVAWHTEDHLTDKSATTYDPVVAERWIKKGWPITPLYYSPQPTEPEPEAEPSSCVEEDGCPKEIAVLKRFWRKNQPTTPEG